jgi:GPH family glycoside/pentoside/hexuronide:cation symporter
MNRHLQFAGYGLASTGNGIYSTVPGLLLMFYMTNIIGIDVKYATLAIFAPKIIDVITDPFMGSISDRTTSRWGRRRPYFLVGTVLLGPLFALLFSSPEFDNPITGFYFVICAYILCTLAYTVFAVPYVAMSAEIPRDYHERTNLNAYRMSFVMIGILASGALAPTIIDASGGGRDGYRYMAMALGLIITLTWLTAFFTTANVRDPGHRSGLPLLTQLKVVAGNRPFVILMLAYIIQLTGMGCLTAALAYFATYILEGDGATISSIFITSNLAALVAMPAWVRVGRRMGKLNALYLCSALLATTYFCMAFFDSDSSRVLFLGVVCLSGIGSGGQQLFSFSMLGDAIVHGHKEGNSSGEAMYAGFFTASEKVGMAFGALVAGVVLGTMGLLETTQGSIDQTEQALWGIRIAFSIVPACFVLLSLVVLFRYRHFEREQRLANTS